MSEYRREELLISAIAAELEGCRHIAVGVLSPIPGSAALLTRARSGAKVSILGATDPAYRADGAVEIFDQAAQGRIDAFFLSGGQIDGRADINLHGVGAYPEMDVRWSGGFGSAFLYFQVPRVILFREEHARRVFPEKVDFISAPGVSPPGVYRPGGPHALVTGLCVMLFDRARGRFRLKSLHPGVTLEEVRDRTGFDFDATGDEPETAAPTSETLRQIREDVAPQIANPYPDFAEKVFGISAA